MSSTTKPAGPGVPPTKPENNPFETAFDGEDTDDEWWEEDDTAESSHSSPSSDVSISQWPKPPEGTGLGLTMKPLNRTSTRILDKRCSVQKPTRDKSKGRQKKLLAKAGIKVVTHSQQQGVAGQAPLGSSQTMPEMARFVDYATLKALGGETPGTFWKGRKTRDLPKTRNRKPSVSSGASKSQHKSAPSSSSQMSLSPSQDKAEDLSPNDRPIVIGISIPTSDLAGHTVSPQTASSDTSKIVRSYEQRTPTVPDTPTIIITPAQESPSWPPQAHGSLDSRLRGTNGVYSNADAHYTASDAPPVPQMPYSVLEDERQRIAAQKSYFSPDSDDVSTWDDGTPTTATTERSRIVSSCTIFEEDESPIIVKAGRAISISAGLQPDNRASMNTVATGRLSKGWWNYITTPFLTRSNTFATREIEDQNPPALPSLAVAAAKAQDVERNKELWEKEFSPSTPETSIAVVSDPWWKLNQKSETEVAPSPVLQETRHKVQTSTGTLPLVYSEAAGFGSASTTSLVPENETQLSRENTTTTVVSVISKEEESQQPSSRELQSNNPFIQAQISHVGEQHNDSEPTSRQGTALTGRNLATGPSIATPPPPYSPQSNRQNQPQTILPQNALSVNQQPASPGPVSPGLHEATMSSGGIPLSNVPLTPTARRPINLNSSYQPELPARSNGNFSSDYLNAAAKAASKKAMKAEEKRRRHEKEEAIAHKAGGLWRGRGCISDRGCYGRSGAEGRKRRRWYFALIIIFLSIVILAVVLATTLHRKSSPVTEPSQWLNLTGFPPVFLGLSTVIAPINIKTNTGCVFPATQWSCALPKELQSSNPQNPSNQPNFFLEIQWDNSSVANSTFSNVTGNPNLITRRVGNPVSAGQFIRHLFLKARQITQFTPSPEPPSFAEEAFLGATTDGIVSDNKAGEPTPFYISFLTKANPTISKRHLIEHATNPFPNVSSVIPAPSLNSDGTAAPANLLPFPTQQPIRLYDRGLPTEHYGFYTYFDRSIFLKSITPLNSSNLDNGEVPADENGGATESEANFRCTWGQTRFLVQMWTRMNTTAQLLNTTSHTSTTKPVAELKQPGSFPYPITITLDRHGGDSDKKLLYCYGMDSREGIDISTGVLVGENRGFGGTLINPAASVFSNTSDPSLGGFDGGDGGCACQWNNFITTVSG